ncbi:MAG: hypothetical protein EPO68_10930 [Planctomycetota bacterium]|nr:MAG: hypothetical protein EPO68_10930 [Planctomycetota bacterium]
MRAVPLLLACLAVGGVLTWTLWPADAAPGPARGAAAGGAAATAPTPAPYDAAGGDNAPPAQSAESAQRAALRADPRVSALIYTGAKTGWYDRDTSDTLPILIEKLEQGMVAPLQRAKEELARGGDAAMVEVERLLRKSFGDRMSAGVLQNALDVACMAENLHAHDLVLLCLDHPRAAVRAIAADALARHHARPEDYDRLLLQYDGETPEVKQHLLRALATADLARAQAQYLQWICERQRGESWQEMVPVLLAATEPALCERAKTCWREALAALQLPLAVLAARAGDAEAEAFVLAQSHSELADQRGRALAALLALGRYDRAGEMLLGDPDTGVRRLALGGLATRAQDPAFRPLLVQVSREPASASGGVDLAEAALVILLHLGEPSAADVVLADLDSDGPAFERALRLLLPLLEERADLAERTWESLQRRAQAEQELPLDERITLFQSIGLVPRAEAARYLREVGLAAAPDAEIKGKRVHEWMMIQASNSGAAGRAWLAGELAHERDPLRRLDLIWAVSAQRCDSADAPCLGRDTLLALVEAPDTAPLEMLFAASRLVVLGPSQTIAPRLKRAVLRVKDPEARMALETLLWTWY